MHSWNTQEDGIQTTTQGVSLAPNKLIGIGDVEEGINC